MLFILSLVRHLSQVIYFIERNACCFAGLAVCFIQLLHHLIYGKNTPAYCPPFPHHHGYSVQNEPYSGIPEN